MSESFEFCYAGEREKQENGGKKNNKCWRASKDNAAYFFFFFYIKSIQTAAESSILQTLFARELRTEIQF